FLLHFLLLLAPAKNPSCTGIARVMDRYLLLGVRGIYEGYTREVRRDTEQGGSKVATRSQPGRNKIAKKAVSFFIMKRPHFLGSGSTLPHGYSTGSPYPGPLFPYF
ncbi:MAG: hypothetical protein PHE44_08625, partial [Proteiniphilum sp.]|nr:hypothetical protein [Proteiniphilum sp.]